MSIELLLKMVDEFVYTRTGKRLDDLELAILDGSWNGKTYPEIADEFGCSEIHARAEGAKLWQKLSDLIGDKVSKAHIRSIVERMVVNSYNSSATQASSAIMIANSHHFKLCPHSIKQGTKLKESEQPYEDETTDRIFLAALPDIEDAISREAELETLTQWVLEDECRLIGLWGLPNVGKSILAAQLVDRIANQFAAVIWHTLTPDTDPHILLEDLNACLSRSAPTLSSRSRNPLTQLCERWRTERCLVILDGLENAFVPGNWAGTWQSDFAEIAQLVALAASCRHHSCLIVTSREIPINWAALETKYKRTRSRVVNGLDSADAIDLLRSQNLTPAEAFPEIVEAFCGHPGWLMAATKAAWNWFDGNAAEFVSFGGLLSEGVLADLTHLSDRLTPSERCTLCFLAARSEAVPIPLLRQTLNISPTEGLALIESLQRRSLIEKVKFGGSTALTLPPALRAWATETLPRSLTL